MFMVKLTCKQLTLKQSNTGTEKGGYKSSPSLLLGLVFFSFVFASRYVIVHLKLIPSETIQNSAPPVTF